MEAGPSVNQINVVDTSLCHTRKYVQSDIGSVHNPIVYDVRRIKKRGLVDCECCDEFVDSNDLDHEDMIFRYDPDSVSCHRKMKKVYCVECLNHIGIITCPIVRGIPAYKTVDPRIVARIIEMGNMRP